MQGEPWIFSAHVTDKRPESRIYGYIKSFGNQPEKVRHPNRKTGRDLNRHFTEEEIQISNNYIKRYSK